MNYTGIGPCNKSDIPLQKGSTVGRGLQNTAIVFEVNSNHLTKLNVVLQPHIKIWVAPSGHNKCMPHSLDTHLKCENQREQFTCPVILLILFGNICSSTSLQRIQKQLNISLHACTCILKNYSVIDN